MNTIAEHDQTYQNAVDAWRTAGFPLALTETDATYPQLPELFNPSRGLPLPISACRPNRHALVQDLTQLDLAWTSLLQVTFQPIDYEILKANLGKRGNRAVIDILGEMLPVAAVRHQATEAYTAANVHLGRTRNTSVTWLSIFDNGKSYASMDELEDGFMHDSTRTILRASSARIAPRTQEDIPGVFPAESVVATAAEYGGKFSVLSGENRIDIKKIGVVEGNPIFRFRRTKIAPVVGNLVVARLPHRARPARTTPTR